jgi:hypothetical protein
MLENPQKAISYQHWKHPVTGRTVRAMLEALPEKAKKMTLLEETL